MSKRRLLLNDNQLDITGGSGSSGSLTVFRQQQQITSDSANSKLLGALTDGVTYVSAFTSDPNLFSGSRSFNVDNECASNSMYEGRLNFRVDSDRLTVSAVIKPKLKIGNYEIVSPLGINVYSNQVHYTFDCRFNIQFYKNSANQNRIIMYCILWRQMVDDTPLSGTQNVTSTINTSHLNNIAYNNQVVSGVQDFDILMTGTGIDQVYINNIFCQKLVTEESSNPATANLKWLQTTTVTGALNDQLLVPDIGSLTFTPSEMTVGKKYRVTFFHYLDEPNNGDVNFDIKFGGNTFLGITTLSTGNGHVNYYDFILEFKASFVYMYLMAQKDSLVVPAFLFASYNSSINQSIEIISKVSLLDHAIVYSKCEILN